MKKNNFTFIVDDNFLSEKNKKFIKDVLLSKEYPYYLVPNMTTFDKNSFFLSDVLVRPEHRPKNNLVPTIKYADEFLDILANFCKNNTKKLPKLKYEILRIAVNMTYRNTLDLEKNKSPIHYDHNYLHYQLLIILDECDPKSPTVILDGDEKTILKKVYPKKYQGCCFSTKPHYGIMPRYGLRPMLVITFR